jgi:hypothetical protein
LSEEAIAPCMTPMRYPPDPDEDFARRQVKFNAVWEVGLRLCIVDGKLSKRRMRRIRGKQRALIRRILEKRGLRFPKGRKPVPPEAFHGLDHDLGDACYGPESIAVLEGLDSANNRPTYYLTPDIPELDGDT